MSSLTKSQGGGQRLQGEHLRLPFALHQLSRKRNRHSHNFFFFASTDNRRSAVIMKDSTLQQNVKDVPRKASCTSPKQHQQEFNRKQCLRALQIANKHASLFTTALNARLTYKGIKIGDDTLRKILNNTTKAMEIALKYNSRANALYEAEVDMLKSNNNETTPCLSETEPESHEIDKQLVLPTCA